MARLRDAIHQADAIIFSAPEYAGALPGSSKSLLGCTIGDAQPGSIDGKAVARVNASTRGPRGRTLSCGAFRPEAFRPGPPAAG